MHNTPPVHNWFSGVEDRPFTGAQAAEVFLRDLATRHMDSPDLADQFTSTALLGDVDAQTELPPEMTYFIQEYLPEVSHYGGFNAAVFAVYQVYPDLDYSELYKNLRARYEQERLQRQ
jgi:hypothetical protein